MGVTFLYVVYVLHYVHNYLSSSNKCLIHSMHVVTHQFNFGLRLGG